MSHDEPSGGEALADAIERHVDNDLLSNRAWIEDANRYLMLAAAALRAQAPAVSGDVVEQMARAIYYCHLPAPLLSMENARTQAKAALSALPTISDADHFRHVPKMVADARASALEEADAEYELWQDDITVATVSGSAADAAREILHYAAVYGQDGPVEIKRVVRTVVDPATIRKLKDRG